MTIEKSEAEVEKPESGQVHLTLDEHKQFADWILKFNVPVSPLAVFFLKLVILFQFTIVGSILWVPWNGAAFSKYIVGFLLIVDFLRITFSKAIKSLVFGGPKVLADIDKTFDDSFRMDNIGVAFIPIYIGVAAVSGIFWKVYSKLPDFIIRFYSIFDDVRHLSHYGFSSIGYRDFSFMFLIILHSVTFLYLLFVSSKTILVYNFRSLFGSRKAYVGPNSSPFNVSRSLMGIPVAIVLALGLHSVLAPKITVHIGNDYDWAGPIAMIIYSFCEYFIVSSTQIFNRYATLPFQARYVKFKKEE